MKTFKLFIYYLGAFILCYTITAANDWLFALVESAVTVPSHSFYLFSSLVNSLYRMLPAAIYLSIVLGLSYSSRRDVSPLVSFVVLFVLSLGLSFGSLTALNIYDDVLSTNTLSVRMKTMGEKGMVINNDEDNEKYVLLGEPGNARSKRIYIQDDKPMLYMGKPANNADFPDLPSISLGQDTHGPVAGFVADYVSVSQNLQTLSFWESFAGLAALCFLLLSLSFIFRFFTWPLAGFIVVLIVSRGVLWLNTYLVRPEIELFLYGLFDERVPLNYTQTVVFFGIGIICVIIHFMLSAVKHQRKGAFL
ncbi:MAG: hypothetical protein LBM77_07890 [Spirochaetaceae bacterium]|nr:hypothetical protein [Spirochaetaceae bacterium]